MTNECPSSGVHMQNEWHLMDVMSNEHPLRSIHECIWYKKCQSNVQPSNNVQG